MLSTLRNTTFRSLRHRDYRRYFAGQIVSFVGTWMQSAALMWLMYDRTNDERWPSWLIVAQIGPTLLFGAWGGSLADRYPKRQIVLLAQVAFLLNALTLALVVACGYALPWLVLSLLTFNGIVQAVDFPARLAFVPDLVPKEDLINAVGLNSLVFNSARALGPAFAGVLFLLATALLPYLPAGANAVTIGATACFVLNALSFVAVIIALRGIPEPRAHANSDRGSIWDGVRYLREHSALGGIVLLTFVLCIFGWPIITILPSFTKLQLGLRQEAYSFLLSWLGAGALAAAFITATFGTVARRKAFLLVGVSACAGGMFGLSYATKVWFANPCCFAVGFGMILFLATAQSMLQLAVPNEKRGRVMAIWAITLSASAPFGHLVAGELLKIFGVSVVLLGMSLGLVAVFVLLAVAVFARRLRKPVRAEH